MVDIPEASSQVVQTLASVLQSAGALDPNYPRTGHVMETPDPLQANVTSMHCAEGDPADPQEAACIVLNQGGDFVRVQPVTWQSQAFFMYRIFVTSQSIFARVDPVKDFVAIDVYLMDEPSLWQDVDQAIRVMADELGARPFRP